MWSAHTCYTTAQIVFDDSYPPMVPSAGNRALAEALSEVNVDLGRGPMKIWDPLRRCGGYSLCRPLHRRPRRVGCAGYGRAHTQRDPELSSMGWRSSGPPS